MEFSNLNEVAALEASTFLSYVLNDEAWICAQQEMKNTQAEDPIGYRAKCQSMAMERIHVAGFGEELLQYWEIYHHSVAMALTEIWQGVNSAISTLKMAVIGVLMMGWLDEQQNALGDEDNQFISKLLPFFYNDYEHAARFVFTIRGMNNMQIVEHTNTLLGRVIDETSCHKELWQVLYNHNKYQANLSNWNKHISVPKRRK